MAARGIGHKQKGANDPGGWLGLLPGFPKSGVGTAKRAVGGLHYESPNELKNILDVLIGLERGRDAPRNILPGTHR